MRRGLLIALSASLIPLLVIAAYVVHANREYTASHPDNGRLVIFSTTDTSVFEPVIEDFRRLHPGIILQYELMDADPLYRRYLMDTRAGRPRADLLLSTSMDLQAKLVNDGHAAKHRSASARSIPQWARWRDEAFGISFEPVVMVFNRRLMAGRTIPRSRTALLADLRRDPEFWRDRIGTYDIARSGVGYLLASQDARLNSESGMLLDSFGDASVFVSDNTAGLLDRLERGEIAMGYNLLGSYARGRVDRGADLEIVFPQEYTLTVSRTAIIPRNAPHSAEAHLFLEYLLSVRGQQVLETQSRLEAVRPEVAGPDVGLPVKSGAVGVLRPIALGPGLLVYLDQRKHAAMIESWAAAIAATPASEASLISPN